MQQFDDVFPNTSAKSWRFEKESQQLLNRAL